MTGNTPRNPPKDGPARCIATGTRGTLTVMGKRFGVEVLDVGDHGIRVSFPFSDWPADGVPVDLDLPSELGCVRYRAKVGYEPDTAYVAGLVLRDPILYEPGVPQRDHCRVPTDLTFQVKVALHPRRFDATVINLSVGGALLRSELAAMPGHELNIDLSLPFHCVESIPAQVVYSTPDADSDDGRLLGVQFKEARPEAVSAISEYIDHRLQAIL